MNLTIIDSSYLSIKNAIFSGNYWLVLWIATTNSACLNAVLCFWQCIQFPNIESSWVLYIPRRQPCFKGVVHPQNDFFSIDYLSFWGWTTKAPIKIPLVKNSNKDLVSSSTQLFYEAEFIAGQKVMVKKQQICIAENAK